MSISFTCPALKQNGQVQSDNYQQLQQQICQQLKKAQADLLIISDGLPIQPEEQLPQHVTILIKSPQAQAKTVQSITDFMQKTNQHITSEASTLDQKNSFLNDLIIQASAQTYKKEAATFKKEYDVELNKVKWAKRQEAERKQKEEEALEKQRKIELEAQRKTIMDMGPEAFMNFLKPALQKQSTFAKMMERPGIIEMLTQLAEGDDLLLSLLEQPEDLRKYLLEEIAPAPVAEVAEVRQRVHADKIQQLKDMGIVADDDHLEELLVRFNGDVNRVLDEYWG